MALRTDLNFPKSWLFVIIPFILFLIYLTVFAQNKYRAEATYVIHDLSSDKKVGGIDLGIFGSNQSSHKMDANIVKQFLISMDMLKMVDARFHLRDYYQSRQTELIERLRALFAFVYRNLAGRQLVDETRRHFVFPFE